MTGLGSPPTAGLKAAPAVTALPLFLGYLALLPFVAAAAATWLGPLAWRATAAQGLLVYAAVVAAFIGAIHWGLAFAQNQPAPTLWLWGVLPSIVVAPAALLPPPQGLWVQAAVLVACYAVDRRVYPQQRAAQWLPLRLRLTVLAVLCCVIGALGPG
jgi:Protein of unknown function (DUF3429)